MSETTTDKDLSLSVIIPTIGSIHDVEPCLYHIARQTRKPCETLIVCGAGRPDQSELESLRARLACTFPVRAIESPVARLTVQRNLGAKHATGDILCYVNDDVILNQEYLKVMSETFAEDETIGVCSARNPTRSYMAPWYRVVDYIIRVIFRLYRPGNGTYMASGWPKDSLYQTKPGPVEVVQGMAVCLRREVLEAVQFDEDIQFYAEDDDFGLSAARKFRLYHQPRATFLEMPEHWTAHWHTHKGSAYEERRDQIHGMTYCFYKNMPSRAFNGLMFRWSLLGLLVRRILLKDWDGLRGTWRGISEREISKAKGLSKRGKLRR